MQAIRAAIATGAIFILLMLAWIAGLSTGAGAPERSARFYSTLRGMHVAGYQGWFGCPNDGGGIGWGHWFRGGADPHDPNSLAIDMWPDTSELEPDELCPTGFRLPSGAPAYLFSNRNPKTVARHFRWMREYRLDGAAMQRFTSDVTKPAMKAHLDTVLRNARAAAEADRRAFFVMYDVSGMHGDAALRVIEADWPYLTGTLHLTDSPAYVFDRARPVVAVWGLGFKDRDISPEQAAAIVRYLRSGPVPATVLGGVPASWRNLGADGRWTDSRTEPAWAPIYRSFDIISPWAAARFINDRGADDYLRFRLVPDVVETQQRSIGYMPVVFPGYSWHHASGLSPKFPLNSIPRRCGIFNRKQIDNAIQAGATMLYTAMFDEYDEATTIAKLGKSRSGTDDDTNVRAGC
jgi:hypothetical protein